MSFWDGSLWEQRYEEQKRRDKDRLDQLHRENPSLSWDDLRTLLEAEKETLTKTVTRCCACTTGKREYVRVGSYLGPCQCKCHLA